MAFDALQRQFQTHADPNADDKHISYATNAERIAVSEQHMSALLAHFEIEDPAQLENP